MLRKLLFFVVFLLILVFSSEKFFTKNIYSKTVSEIQTEIESYEKELEKLSLQNKTLSNQIKQFDAQINLTQLKISETEEKIALLGRRIEGLEVSLDTLTNAFTQRAKEVYKMKRNSDFIEFIASTSNVSTAVSRYYYLQKILNSDQDLLLKLQKVQDNYKTQKEDQEKLAKQLESQKKSLSDQKRAKTRLLEVTKNDEKKYQEFLASARAELAVTLGQGKETFLREVREGDKIGTIIRGTSGCSSGTHLHFEIHQGDNVVDPNNLLKPISFNYYPGYDTSYYGGISPHGNWNWPLSEPIQINQGFGSHGYAKAFYPGGVHNGIDMESNDSTVRAVKPGKLYAGSYQCGGRYVGTLLYAKIDASEGITNWYLHINPQ